MSFGLEISDEGGRKTFEVGRKYLKITGSVYFPALVSTSIGSLKSEFTLPPSVPLNEIPFIKVSVFDSADSFVLNGREVLVNRSATYQQGAYHIGAARVYYGYYS